MAEYITGDCHGDFQKVEVFCRRMQTTIEDCMIILGDAGINYCMDHRDTERKKYLAGLPITVFCVYGNHEERPSNISSYRKKKWKNGTVYFEPEYPNLIFAKDGEIYEFSGKKVLVIGGAGSPYFQSRKYLYLYHFHLMHWILHKELYKYSHFCVDCH